MAKKEKRYRAVKLIVYGEKSPRHGEYVQPGHEVDVSHLNQAEVQMLIDLEAIEEIPAWVRSAEREPEITIDPETPANAEEGPEPVDLSAGE